MWEAENTLPCSTIPEANCTDLPVGKQFINIADGLEGGLPYQPSVAELMKKRASNGPPRDNPGFCLPAGVPRVHAIPTFKKVVQTPGLLVILDEYNASYRQIFTDGRPLPEDPNRFGMDIRLASGRVTR
jgi:hypothetical protein